MSVDPKISIIVPVFNVENCIKRCLESIIGQSYTHFELLLINDGSTDNSGTICDEYSKKDKRIKVFHQENAGVSSARNKGITNAKYDLICFIDSDDWIEIDYLNQFFKFGIPSKNSITIQGLACDNLSNDSTSYRIIKQGVYRKNNIGFFFIENNMLTFGAPYCKLYQRSIIVDNHIFFPARLSYGEDTLFFLEYLQYIETVYSIDSCSYHYMEYNNQTLSKKNHIPENLFEFYSVFYSLVNQFIQTHKIKDLIFISNFQSGLIKGYTRSVANMYRLSYTRKERMKYLKKTIPAFRLMFSTFNNLSFWDKILKQIYYAPHIVVDSYFNIIFTIKDNIIKK